MKWTTQPLANVADFCLGKMLDERKNKGEFMPYLANVNVRWGEFDLRNLREMRFEQRELLRYGLRPGDIVMCEGGEPGRCAIWKEQQPRLMLQKALHRIRPHECLDYRFLYYSFLLKGRQGGFAPLFTGATIKHLPKQHLAKVEISFPSRPDQERIAQVLSAYDDLIENNRRRIQLLEESARLLYKEWFVHLRFPGHEKVKVVDGVPAGWERKRVDEVATLQLGKMLDQKKNRGDFMRYLANVNVRWGEFNLSDLREMRFETHELKKFGLKYGDIVMCEGGEPGRCAIWKDEVPDMMVQKALHRIRVLDGMDFRFLFHALSYHGQAGRLASLFTGATIKHLPREKLKRVEIDVPPTEVVYAFVEKVRPLEQQLHVLRTGIRRASEARDLLLPRLMNGEITV